MFNKHNSIKKSKSSDVYNQLLNKTFLCEKAENSDRPEFILTGIMAAPGHFYQVSGSNELPVWLHNLKHALTKTCSTKAKGRTPIMPVTELNALFDSCADNEFLYMKKLRQK